MTDKAYRQLENKLRALGKKWLETLGFRSWDVKVLLIRELCQDNPDCVARCDAQWEYKAMTLKFYAHALEGMDDRKLEEIYVHECCHGIVNEMRMWGPEEDLKQQMDNNQHHEERVVSEMTRAILWARYDGVQEGKKSQ